MSRLAWIAGGISLASLGAAAVLLAGLPESPPPARRELAATRRRPAVAEIPPTPVAAPSPRAPPLPPAATPPSAVTAAPSPREAGEPHPGSSSGSTMAGALAAGGFPDSFEEEPEPEAVAAREEAADLVNQLLAAQRDGGR